MIITTGKTLYVNTENLELFDGFERNAPYCQLTGERQVVIDAECFEGARTENLFSESPELLRAAEEIARMIATEKPDDINIYC